MLRSYVRRATHRENRYVIAFVTSVRRCQTIPLGSVIQARNIRSTNATMVAGQSMTAARDAKAESDVKSNTIAGMTGNMKKEKKSINFLRGWPATSLLPAAALRAASQTALTDPSIWAPGLEYGPDPGYQPLREALARWLGRFYGGVIPTISNTSTVKPEEDIADRITITGGASQSLACLLQSFTDPGQTLAIWVVAPCYFLACPIFEDAGFGGRLRAVPEDAEGVDIAVLEREMSALEERQKRGEGENSISARYKTNDPHRKIYRHVVYCVPAFSNPSGRTTTCRRREELVGLARTHDALIICDDVYDMLQWNTTPSPLSSDPENPPQPEQLHTALLPRIADIDIARGRSAHDPEGKHFGHAVSNGSFSKLVAPGTRTGWTYSTADLALGLSRTGSTRSGGAASQIAATIVCELLLDKSERSRGENPQCELDTHIRHVLLPSYARRHAILMRAIRDTLVPLGLGVSETSLVGHGGIYGGYFVWMTLPRAEEGKTWPTAQAIADCCRADEDLMIGNGELFAVSGDESMCFEDAIRLCFAWLDEEDLVDGVERLGRVIRRMLDEGPGGWERSVPGLSQMDQAK
ncbi:pyridoxal phosphate-dependent transferase [Xylaria bambusicola]|uniref:pyridoxal phosphate-dependent transferase n=1 Tax=Xylaria bambusicola TaxID=326684 RepID=UPI002008E4CF|nr:pyridoxal phosphate-dependent transferase [Xylaria bambusicola]KAI0516866.1 pyridoxal phosphate-dependent transferase [Xylaria bambusicola]